MSRVTCHVSCVTLQGRGGDNQFVDGFHVAARLREEHPDTFKLLR